jgi:hypothetical protein
MINTFLAFVLLSIAMYLAIKVLNVVVFARFNLLPKPEVIKPQSNAEQVVETLVNSLQIAEFSSGNVLGINAGENEAEAVYSEVVTHTEGLVEGVQAISESAGEHLTTMMESLSNQ